MENIGLRRMFISVVGIFGVSSVTHVLSNCGCPNVNVPVCGTDNNTYDSICHLDYCSGKSVEFFYSGECRAPGRNCNPPKIFTPVCGQDGVTYRNKWDLFCNGNTMKHTGPCRAH